MRGVDAFSCVGEVDEAAAVDVDDEADLQPGRPWKVVAAAALDVVVCLVFFFVGDPGRGRGFPAVWG